MSTLHSGAFRIGRVGAAGVALVLMAGLLVAGPGASARLGSSDRRPDGSKSLTVNIALTGTATATTWQSNATPDMALDGNAATAWCSTQWTGTLTVDLGQVRNLGGFGLTLIGG